jgi:hypothetical protein
VRLLSVPGIGLIGTLAFHADPAVTESVARAERGGIFNTSRRPRGVSTKTGLCATVAGFGRGPTRGGRVVASVSSPSFPHLWKTLWKSGRFTGPRRRNRDLWADLSGRKSPGAVFSGLR